MRSRTVYSIGEALHLRGYHVAYRPGCHCPGCGRSNWLVGRIMAECGFCSTAIVLAGEPCRYDEAGGKVAA